MKWNYTIIPASLFAFVLVATLPACQNNEQQNSGERPAYVHPAKTIPVTPEKTKTRQDNIDVDKTIRVKLADSAVVQQDEEELKLAPNESLR